ncbi:MAG: DUF4369 domain-containing protein [Prevotella sp.]|nr:DUF4369 domain-containing protein [Prevotella sp.]
MKHLLCIITTLMLLMACGVDSGHFKISGRFLNMSQGNFYVYSPDGVIDGIDTISVVGGRFTYERPIEQEGTLMLVFPNFSEHPVFAQPGKSVTVNADASHMKEMDVKGTKANELMTKFRKQTAKASPPEATAKAEEFINEYPESPVSLFLLKKYFVQTLTPDYAKAEQLATMMLKEQPKNGQLVMLQKQLTKLKNSAKGASLAKFSAKDMQGNTVTDADLGDGVAVVTVWSSWNFESQEQQRQLRRKVRSSGGKIKVVSICVDANRKQCESTIERDTINWPVILDDRLFENPTLQQLGLSDVPDNLVINHRRVVDSGLNTPRLMEKLDELLK